MWEFLGRFFDSLLARLGDIDGPELMAASVAALVFLIFRKSIGRAVGVLWTAVTTRWELASKIERARSAVSERSHGLWLEIEHDRSLDNDLKSLANRKLILTVANLKGGVGKTTLTANLAAYFANPFGAPDRPRRKVIAIDLDFQGSLSSMMFAGTDWTPAGNLLSAASELVSGSRPQTAQTELGQPVVNCPGARGVGAFYDLARVENREMVRWLLKDCDDDLRYRLARILLSEAVFSHFDVILIDAPPRLTTGCIQALCASTHVLIPTIPDPLAATGPVGYFGAQLKAHEDLFPHLKILGVIGTKTNVRSREAEEDAVKKAANRLRDALRGSARNLGHIETRNETFDFRHDLCLVDSTPLARAAEKGIAYVSLSRSEGAQEIRNNIDIIGKEVERRWHL